MICLSVLIQYRRVTDRQATLAIDALYTHSVTRLKTAVYHYLSFFNPKFDLEFCLLRKLKMGCSGTNDPKYIYVFISPKVVDNKQYEKEKKQNKNLTNQ